VVLTVLAVWSTVVAHEKNGFVVLPNQVPRLSGPLGSEAEVAEILATREQTGGSFGVWRYTKVLEGGPPLHIHRTEDEFFYVLSGEVNFQRGAYYVDRILQGSKPADLPVEQPMHFELVINFKTAEALGLTLPPHLLVLGDRGDMGGENRCTRLW
jgi:mannose-6-phosphate isomerase-like protein (cupin superfamily)